MNFSYAADTNARTSVEENEERPAARRWRTLRREGTALRRWKVEILRFRDLEQRSPARDGHAISDGR